eukprot:CAMPEP_0184110588 /NCGR_PEP_ID=MMETSP0974-20121125/17478_1 /TAXON_ID=483370 /ORGANISM="non described non described, Strain CCMP2097" /LENGTH=62 /DNA_ID=CAMNT_0026413657 /DNA_START=159 /DNA_END=348 /DNA_ORIENTATION=+
MFTASSDFGSALGAMLGAPPAVEWARTYDDCPPTIRRLSADYQNLIFRPLHQDDAVDSDKTS